MVKLEENPLFPPLRHSAAIVLTATSWTLSRLFTSEIVPADGYIWLPMSWDFFGSISESDGVHRPLYGFLAYLLVKSFEIANGFGFPASDISGFLGGSDIPFPSSVVLAWVFLNYLSLVSSGLTAFIIFRKLRLPSLEALLFALIVCTATESFAYANYTLIQPAGFFGIYLMGFIVVRLYMILGGAETGRFSTGREISLSFLLIGVLMLGKAEYYFVIFGAFWIAILTKRFLYVALAIISGVLPVLAWIGLLALFGIHYENYEVSRRDYSLFGWWLDVYRAEGLVGFLHQMLVAPLTSDISVLLLGLGTIPTATLLIMIIRTFPSRLSLIFISYSLFAVWFLRAVNFWLPRHAYEIAPLAYASLAVALGHLWRHGIPLAQECSRLPPTLKARFHSVPLGRGLVVVTLLVVVTSNISRAGLAIW